MSELLSETAFRRDFTFLPFSSGGICWDVIRSRRGLIAAFGLRFQAYSECGYINPSHFPLKREFDEYDCRSAHFCATDTNTGRMLGYARLILDTTKKLQIENYLGISDYRDKYGVNVSEMSRFIVYPRGNNIVSRGIRYCSFRAAFELGIRKILGISRKADRHRFERMLFRSMEPYREITYSGTRFEPLTGQTLYGNVFHLDSEWSYVSSLRHQTTEKWEYDGREAP